MKNEERILIEEINESNLSEFSKMILNAILLNLIKTNNISVKVNIDLGELGPQLVEELK